ncbi:lytic transglycosylase domain-containing protein [Sphingomonas sp. Leaf412]|uniref:lytic transglycosylase domain-containing protein n=1 Tax=Sphingomonas sp. Leaf412 TaxID=1736370 RepID=UPI0009E78E43|nr:lytic transglycosylase domain-containing protein [Sphingomonas sp. Leaf412]
MTTAAMAMALAGDDVQQQPVPAMPAPAPAPVVANPAGVAQAVAQWKAITTTDALPFDTYATFLAQHPGWPGAAAIRRTAEKKAADGTASPSGIAAFCGRYPPLTAAGTVACAKAYRATGAMAQADAAARAAWRLGNLAPQDESAILTQFPGALTAADHDRRMDMLLWQGATGAAARQIAFVSPAARPLLESRLAFRTGAATASALAAANDAVGARDAGYVADKATWLRNAGASPSARTWLARTRTGMTTPGDVEEFYEVLLASARGAAADGQHQQAYDIARQIDDAYPPGTNVSTKPYGERDDYTSLAWLAGQTALTKIARPGDAMVMFRKYAEGSQSPQTRAKGFYWSARAAEAAGRTAEADALFRRTADFRDQFYGQLANEHLGRALMPPPPVAAGVVDPAARRAFQSREVVQAAVFLGQAGQYQDQTAFVRQIAADATSDSDHLLADELSRTLRRPDLGVLVGRSAMQNGLTEYSATAFPTVAVPSGHEPHWTMIHAISRQESQFDRAARSPVGATGLMQLMPGTAREQAGKLGLPYDQARLSTDTGYNIQLGSGYFQRIFANYGSYPLAIAAYNAGPGNVNKWLRANGDPRTGAVDMVDWIEAIPFGETKNYVQRVLENAVVYDLMNPPRAKSRGPANLSWYMGRSKRG